MTAEVTEQTAEIRGVNVRLASVIVAGHTVEQVLSFDVAEAEAVHGRPFDDELDKHIQMGMLAIDRISADGTIGKVVSATSYLLGGKCVRTAKIEHCNEIEPASASWRINRADGSQGALELPTRNPAKISHRPHPARLTCPWNWSILNVRMVDRGKGT